jgi:hypothetical protein
LQASFEICSYREKPVEVPGIGYTDGWNAGEDGMTPAEFNTYPALVATAVEFSKATEGMVDFIAQRLVATCG